MNYLKNYEIIKQAIIYLATEHFFKNTIFGVQCHARPAKCGIIGHPFNKI